MVNNHQDSFQNSIKVRALVVCPLVSTKRNKETSLRNPLFRLNEAVGLAKAIDLDVVNSFVLPLTSIQPKAFLGSGKINDINDIIEDKSIELVIIDANLSGGQQKHLEEIWNLKVIDRTSLILEIFGRRARSREGSLQVELAALQYQRGRLVRSWTHLERQRGGYGFLGGPGETQIEADKRHIDSRIQQIHRDLEKVVRTRRLHRKNRSKVPWPVCALVGYTNAGKSSLFNTITTEDVFSENMLFATLDPTMRSVELPNGTKVIFSDTVGFISDLPPDLIAAFRATLEEVIHADIILHVQDISSPDYHSQFTDVINVLKALSIFPDSDNRIINILNKIDLLDNFSKEKLVNSSKRKPHDVIVSAENGEGVGELLNVIEALFLNSRKTINVDVSLDDGKSISWLYSRGRVFERHDDSSLAHIKVSLNEVDIARFRKTLRSDD